MNTYPAPLDRLLTLGESPARDPEWPDYLALGVGPEHVPDLIRMASDARLHDADEPEAWAPIHAWRALGQLRAADAVEPLISLFHTLQDNDWMFEELPSVLAMIGPAAIPALAAYLERRELGREPRLGAAESLAKIGQITPETRAQCVAVLEEKLAHFATQDRTLNAFLVSGLLDLGVVEAGPLIERAYAADRVDISMCGDWEDVQIALGLLPERRTPRPDYFLQEELRESMMMPSEPPRHHPAHDAKTKARRKMARQSRRRNRGRG